MSARTGACGLGLLVIVAAPAAPAAAAQEVRTYRVEALGTTNRQVFLVETLKGRLAAGREDLAAWGLLNGAGPRAQIDGVSSEVELYWLDEIENVQVAVSEDDRVVRLTPSPESVDSRVAVSRLVQPDFELERAWGVDLTYRAQAQTRSNDRPLLDALGALGVSLGSLGRLDARLDFGPQAAVAESEVEGETTELKSSRPPRVHDVPLRRDFGSGRVFFVGQLNSTPGASTSGLEYLGASLGSNVLGRDRATLSSRYATFQDLVTLAEPATVEVRVNGRLVASRHVGVGRLGVSEIPIDAGDNDVEILVRHADGRVEVFDRSMVGGVDFLGAGEADFGVAAGLLATRDAPSMSDYETPFGSVYWARGLTADHTLRWHAEGRTGSSGHVASRAEWASRLPGGFVTSVGFAGSASRAENAPLATDPMRADSPFSAPHDPEGRGWEADVRVERSFASLNVAFGGSRSSAGYRTMRQVGFAREARSTARFDGRWTTGFGLVGVLYRYRQDWDESMSSSFAATLQRRVPGGSVRLRAGYESAADGGGFSGSLAVVLGLGRRGPRANVDVRTGSTGTESSVGVSRPMARNARGVAWSVRAARRSPVGHDGIARPARTSANISALYRGSLVEVRGSARSSSGGWSGSAELAGSFVLMGGRLFMSSPVGPSYLLVDAGEGSDVSVLQNRRTLGRTDARGDLFIPFLSSLSRSRIELDPRSLGTGLLAERLRREVTLAPGAAVLSFAVRRSLQAVLTLVDGDGAPWPAGTEVRGEDDRVAGVVGKNGLAHLVDLRSDETLRVVGGLRTCVLRLDLDQRPARGRLRLGMVPCEG